MISESSSVVSVFSLGLTAFFMWIFLFFGLVAGDPGFIILPAAVLLLRCGGGIWSRLSLKRLEFSLELDRDRIFPGEEIRLKLSLYNRKLLPVRVSIELPVLLDRQQYLSLDGSLASFDSMEKRQSFSPAKRGVYNLGSVLIRAGDPTGLYEKERSASSDREILVFPRIRPLKGFDVSFQEYFGINAAKGLVEDPAWYAGTRDYSGLRPAKYINWKAGAHLGRLQEKLFEPTSHRKVLFVMDLRGFLENRFEGADDTGGRDAGEGQSTRDAREAFEESLEATASIARDLMESGASFGWISNGRVRGGDYGFLEMGRGPEHLGRLLELLARLEFAEVERDGREDFGDLLYRMGREGMGFVYLGFSPDERTELFYTLPAERRKKLIFIFSRLPKLYSASAGPEKLSKVPIVFAEGCPVHEQGALFADE